MKNKGQQQAKTFYERFENYWKNNKIVVVIVCVVGVIIGIAALTDAVKTIKNNVCSKDEIKQEPPIINHQEIIGDGNNQAGGDINITTKDSIVKSGK